MKAQKGHTRKKKIQENYESLRFIRAAISLRVWNSEILSAIFCAECTNYFDFNPLKTNGRLLYLKTQFEPRCKHFSFRL
jgi:hypothetical protein